MIENLDADALLEGDLGRWLAEQEGPRRDAVSKSNRRFAIGALVAAALLYFIYKDGLAQAGFWFVLTPFAVMVPAVWAYWPRWTARQKVKEGINRAIAQAVGVTYSRSASPDPAFSLLGRHKMLPGHNKRTFDDFWEGQVAGSDFRLFEAHLIQETRDSNGKSNPQTKFRGVMLNIGCTAKFTGTTIVQRAGAHKRFGFFGGKKDAIEAAGKNLAAVDMVHPVFEDSFDVYATDQVEARMLIHPSYVERLIAIEEAFRGGDLRALFCEGSISVMLTAKDMFESGGLDPAKDREKVAETIRQFRSLAELAIELNRH
ncbi:MAG: DUF3137 domain-containing protein [Erythrobacter sp.]|nr:DUF3137 domain-containing protein [Erythrobacter sp.]